MKLFLDTEFTGLQQHTSLISLALVAESGDEFYAEFNDFDKTQTFDWLEDHVLAKLEFNHTETLQLTTGLSFKIKASSSEIVEALRKWLEQFESVEIWADVLAYDWVLFCELFGGARNLPEHIFYAPFDISTLFRLRGLITPINNYQTDLNRFNYAGVSDNMQHHALHDARVEKICYEKMMSI